MGFFTGFQSNNLFQTPKNIFQDVPINLCQLIFSDRGLKNELTGAHHQLASWCVRTRYTYRHNQAWWPHHLRSFRSEASASSCQLETIPRIFTPEGCEGECASHTFSSTPSLDQGEKSIWALCSMWKSSKDKKCCENAFSIELPHHSSSLLKAIICTK